MATIVGHTFNAGNYGVMETYTGANAKVLAIKNLILARPGNYPETPSLGINIEKYQFDLLDDQTIDDIKNDMGHQISKYIPDLDNVTITVDKIVEDNDTYLGISVSANTDGDNLMANFLVIREEREVKIYNEIL